jgi:hypothetical protein
MTSNGARSQSGSVRKPERDDGPTGGGASDIKAASGGKKPARKAGSSSGAAVVSALDDALSTSLATGTLRLNSRPWSYVRIDGVSRGTTPQMELKLKPGKHTVTLNNPNFGVKRSFVVTIRPNQTVTHVVTLTH